MKDRAARTDGAGRAAEAVAELVLRLKGYRILARRFRSGVGEVDLVAFKSAPRFGRKRALSGSTGVLVFVEVKRRASLSDAAESVTAKQRTRIARAAEAFLKRNPAYGAAVVRFDAVLVARGGSLRHVTDAWRP